MDTLCSTTVHFVAYMSIFSGLIACGESPANQALKAKTTPIVVAATTDLVNGVFVFQPTIPARIGDCDKSLGEICTDVDDDGLVDAWEDLLLEYVRPYMIMHTKEPLLDPNNNPYNTTNAMQSNKRMGYIGRVFAPDPHEDLIRTILISGYSLDPGFVLGITAHDGDSERIAIELKLLGKKNAVMTSAYFAIHEYTLNEQSSIFKGDSLLSELLFDTMPSNQVRWIIFPSKSKHPNFPNPLRCHQSRLRTEICAPSKSEGVAVLPPWINAGEPDLSGVHPEYQRINDLTTLGFPGEQAWKEQGFCGGLRGYYDPHPLCPQNFGKDCCAESIASKLLRDPFVNVN